MPAHLRNIRAIALCILALCLSCSDIILPAEPGDSSTDPNEGAYAELFETAKVDFGEVDCGTAAREKVLVLTNRRKHPFDWDGTLLKGNDSPFTLSEDNGPVAPGQSVHVVVRPKPIPAVALTERNLFGDVLRVTTNAPGLHGPFDVPIEQTAHGAVLRFIGDTVAFGKTREAVTKEVDLQNVGNAPVGVTIAIDAPFTVTPGDSVNVNPGAKLAIAGRFAPTGGHFGNFHNALRLQAKGPLCGKIPQAIFAVSYPDTPVSMCGGEGFSCALGQSGHVFCWGANFYGQLGIGTETNMPYYSQVQNLEDATVLACGYQHVCAIRRDKTVVCWGGNGQKKQFEAQDIVGPGQLGNGTNVDSSVPVPVTGLTDVVAIQGGYGHTCAIREQGASRTVWCWGRNTRGELGNGAQILPRDPARPAAPSLVPIPVVGLGSDIVHLSVSRAHGCVVKSDKTMWCWGENDSNELGNASVNGTSPDSVSTPLAVNGLADAEFPVTAGYHSCAVRTSGAVVCWGVNSYGRLGMNDEVPPGTYGLDVAHGTIDYPASPDSVPVTGLVNPVYIAGGSGHTCALRQDKIVVCWGRNNQGMLGDGVFGNGRVDLREPAHGFFVGVTSVPQPVKNLTGVKGLYVAYNHTCAITESNVPYCWGSDQNGELGDGRTEDSNVPVLVDGF